MYRESEYRYHELGRGKVPGVETGIEVRKTICSICNPLSHCGIDAYVKNGMVLKVEGTRENPHSEGTLCSKGNANRQYIYHKDRIRTPLIRKGDRESGHFVPISWKEALDFAASSFLKIKEESGPEAVVFYAGFPKWMRPFLKRLAHSFGSPNYCTESSTCFRPASWRVHSRMEPWAQPILAAQTAFLCGAPTPFTLTLPLQGTSSKLVRGGSRSLTWGL